MAVSALKITTRLNSNDKKKAAADPSSSNKKSKKDKKKKKKDKSSIKAKSYDKAKSYEEVTEQSFIMDPNDWQESYEDLSYDDVSTMVGKAVTDEYTDGPASSSSYDSPSVGHICRYYVYKIWPGKVVVKRSYNNRNSDDALFVMHPYTIDGDTATLGDGEAVDLGFVPAGGMQSQDFMVAMREADHISLDDPELANALVEPDPEEDPMDIDDELDGTDEEESDDEEDEEGEEGEEEDKEDEEEGEVKEEAELREDVQVKDFTETFGFDNIIDSKCNIVEQVDKKTGKLKGFIIENMAMLGGKSKNNRSYSNKVRQSALKMFEGAKAYCDHPDPDSKTSRGVRELIGSHRNVYFDEATDMVRSNLHLSPTDTVKGYIIPHARANPGMIGNSINAAGKIDAQGNVLEITKCKSVDIVSDPATTNGLWESVQDTDKDTNNKGGKNMKDEDEEGKSMKELVEEVIAGRADQDAINRLRAHFDEENEVVGSVEEMQEELEELREENAEYKVKEAAREAAQEVAKLLKESKLPAESKADAGLIEILSNADSESRPTIIARFEKIAEAASKGSKKADKSDDADPSHQREKDIDEDTQVDRDKLVERMMEGFVAPQHRRY